MWLSVMAVFLAYATIFILFEDYDRKFIMPFNEVSDWHLLLFSLVVMAGLGFLLFRYAKRMDERISREQTEKENRMRRELTQNIAHELKTPVASILGYTDTILDSPDMTDEVKHQFIVRTNAQAHRLTTLLQDISTLNRMDYARDMITMERVNVSELFADTAKYHCPRQLLIAIQHFPQPDGQCHQLCREARHHRSLCRAVARLLELHFQGQWHRHTCQAPEPHLRTLLPDRQRP